MVGHLTDQVTKWMDYFKKWFVYIVLELLEVTGWLTPTTCTVACYNVLQSQPVTHDKIE